MPIDSPGPIAPRQRVNRREFLRHAGWSGVGATALVAAAGRRRASAESSSPYPDWIPPSPKPPKRGGMLTRASTWDPPVLDPRLTNSVGLFQFAALVGSRLVRYPFSDEATGTTDLTLKGDLAESWQGSPDQRVWTFKLRQGVRWHNAPPLNGRECVAADIKACYEAYAKEGVQSFTFREIEGMETPDKYTLRVHLNTPNVMFPQNVAEPIAVIFPREVLEEDGDLKKRMIGTGPFVLKEHTRKVRVALARNPDYFDRGRPYVDAYDILSTPDAATRLAAFRTGQSDVIWLASPSEVETVRKTNPAAVVQEYKNVQTVFGLALAQDKPPLLPGPNADGGRARPLVAIPPGGSEKAPGGVGPSQRLRDDAILLRVLPADDLPGPARSAGSEAEPPHQRQNRQAGLHDLLRPLRRGEVGRDGLGVQVGPRDQPRRADLSVHALKVDEELLPLR